MNQTDTRLLQVCCMPGIRLLLIYYAPLCSQLPCLALTINKWLDLQFKNFFCLKDWQHNCSYAEIEDGVFALLLLHT